MVGQKWRENEKKAADHTQNPCSKKMREKMQETRNTKPATQHSSAVQIDVEHSFVVASATSVIPDAHASVAHVPTEKKNGHQI